MNRKEAVDLILSKVGEGKKEAFIQEVREAKTKEERMAVIRKYGIALKKEDLEALKDRKGSEVSDAELDAAAGGCNCACSAHCSTDCICGY